MLLRLPTSLRPARDDDYEAFTRLFPELRVPDPTPTRETWCGEYVPHTLVAEEAGAVVGYLRFLVYTSEGVVQHLVVAPSHQGRRLGQRLMEAAAAVMRERGATRWALNVKPDNASALALYGRLGMRETSRMVALRFDWSLVERLPPAPSALAARALTTQLDAEVERTVPLPRGSLAQARALPGRVLFAVQDLAAAGGPAIAGVGVFTPGFPGSFPFRATSPGAARALLEAMRPFALPEKTHMQVVSEGQPELAAALRDAGAKVVLEALHLEGPLPPA